MEFSKRNECIEQEFLIKGKMSKKLRLEVWNLYSKNIEEISKTLAIHDSNTTITEDIMSRFGIDREYSESGVHGKKAHDNNIIKLKSFICEKCEWYEIYDFIEHYIELDEFKIVSNEINLILERNLSVYRLVKNHIIPIINEIELEEIKKAAELKDNKSNYIISAIKEYSNKIEVNYNKVITDSISAVEATFVELIDGKKNTLSSAIKYYERLENANINQKLLEAIIKLYKFSCDDGLRHGGKEYYTATDEEARLYLVICSALCNYLSVKQNEIVTK